MPEALVTGALGNVGSAVVRSLRRIGSERGADLGVVAAGRSPEALRRRFGSEVSAVRLDFTDETTFAEALSGVDRIFLIRPPAIARVGPTLNRFIDHAAAAGVRRVVFSSVAGADEHRIVPHHRIERHLVDSGLAWTFLRPGFFAQNLETAYAHEITSDDRISVPAGDARVAFVDTRDVGAAAAVALLDDRYVGTTHHLTGPEALTFDDVAEVLSAALGRDIRYRPVSVPRYLAGLWTDGMALPRALVQTVLHADLRRGTAEAVSPDLERMLGRPPTSLGRYVADHLELWARRSRATG